MDFVAKYFQELTTVELYEILKARAQVFVVEQRCVYQDLDDVDYGSLHIFCRSGQTVLAYLRVFPKAGEAEVVQMGRVLTTERKTGLGGRLLREGIRIVRETIGAGKIYLEAQCYAVGFYEREGFKICSGAFLEDGIPHVQMELEL